MGDNYRPTGDLQGDTKPLPDRGTRTGVTDTYGASLDQDSTNRLRGISGGTRSDAPFERDANDTAKDGDE